MIDFQFRVPDGKTFKYKFGPETTIAMVKKQICELNNYDELKTKIIHRCSILNDDTKIQDIKITPIEYIIVQPFSTIPTSINKNIGKLPELQPPRSLSPSEISEALNNLELIDQSHKGSVKTLLEMGFSLQDSIRGLRSNGYDVEAAAEYLTSDCYDNENANDFRRLDRQKFKENSRSSSFPESFIPPGLSLGTTPGGPMNQTPGISLNGPQGHSPNISIGTQPNTQVNPSANLPFGQNPFFNPFSPLGTQPPQLPPNMQNPHNQYFEYRILTQEQKRQVDELAQEYSHLPFDIILQLYEANDKNIEKTKDALK